MFGKLATVVGGVCFGVLGMGSLYSESVPAPLEATIHEPGQPRENPYFFSKRAYQEGAAIVPYLVDLLPIELALLDTIKGVPSIPIRLYGPSICLTDPVILQPLGDSSANYGDEAWAELVPEGQENRVIALNVEEGVLLENEAPFYGIDLRAAASYEAVEGWVDSGVLGWIYSYGVIADDYTWGGWYYHPWRETVYIVDAGIEKIPRQNPNTTLPCPDDEVNSYYLWDPSFGSWLYLSAGYPDWVYDYSFGQWVLTTPHLVADEAYIGLTEAEALAQAEADNNRLVRVVSIDGESLPVTADYSFSRINFTLVGGVVTGVSRG